MGRHRPLHSSTMAEHSRQFEGEGHSKIYAQYRPLPPESLVWQILKNLYEAGIRTSGPALDVGCGSGQFTRLLPPHFSRVIATDVSKAQLDQAMISLRDLTNVEIKIGAGERLEAEDASLHLVSTCQALHWF